MIHKDLLAILACPVTRMALGEADETALAELNSKVAAGAKNVGGEAVTGPLEGALIRADRKLAYPIVDGIPVLLENEGIALD